jgi:hypothetical protein
VPGRLVLGRVLGSQGPGSVRSHDRVREVPWASVQGDFRLHAAPERVAHDLLDRNDPDLDPYPLDKQRLLCRGSLLAALSLLALVSGNWSAWQAARVEVAQKKQEERRAAEDTAGEIVERVVEETIVAKQR